MTHKLHRIVVVFWSAIAFGAVGLIVLGVSIATASIGFDRCGPSALDALDIACRAGVRMLMVAFAMLSIALVLGAIALTMLWRERAHRRRLQSEAQ
ncbi:hypothetical protein DWG18_03110 [Lysobacter sp. TY2-98]|uniref:hypothetical protein n=1 Tax=Lysobacter sp. TY2-98 TaxID=2290922 RepID=UPI000E2072B1|nr:hypothetical protein [Lysobacter sp. TY2-98]AXK71379.1 hypothetical protein DWG18_03110 [Lysobacter sp. TY2-98]